MLPIGLARQKFRCAKSCWLANHVSVPSWRGPVWARSAVCEPKSADPTADEARDDSDVTVSRSSVRHSHTLEPNQAGLLSWTARRRSATRACVIESRRVSRCTFAPARLYTSPVLAVWNAGHLTVRFARRCGPPALDRRPKPRRRPAATRGGPKDAMQRALTTGAPVAPRPGATRGGSRRCAGAAATVAQ